MPVYSSSKALVIGIGRYADPKYDLTYARTDAEAVAETLRNEFAFDEVWTLLDADATRQNILRFLERDLQQSGTDDGIMIFFAGHGITVTSGIGDDRGFLVPHDGDPQHPHANLSLTTIRDDLLPMMRAKHVFLVVDACYGGLALRDVVTKVGGIQDVDDNLVKELTRSDRKVRQVLAAGTKDQKVLDGGLFGHSVFTGRLIEGLHQANPYVTADRVGLHVRETVARDCIDRHHRQTPQFGYLVGGDGTFVFHRWTKSFVVPSASPESRQPRRPQRLDANYLESILAAHAISEVEAPQLLDEWSFGQPRLLSPICEHALFKKVSNLWALRVQLKAIVEDRHLTHRAEPYAADVHKETRPFREDIWALPFRAPEGLTEKEYSYAAPVPDRISTCAKCSGSGRYECPACHGKKQVQCQHCHGAGREPSGFSTYYELKCQRCHGAKIEPCTTCKGADPHPCDHCGGSGRVALFPVVTAKYSVLNFPWVHFSDGPLRHEVSKATWDAVSLGQITALGSDIPRMPDYLPPSLRSRAETAVTKMFQKIEGRIHRTVLSVGVMPFCECHLVYRSRPFTMIITGVAKEVVSYGEIPLNRRRWVGMNVLLPAVMLCFGVAVITLVIGAMVKWETGSLPWLTCVIAAICASMGTLLGGASLWAIFSKPKSKKESSTSAS